MFILGSLSNIPKPQGPQLLSLGPVCLLPQLGTDFCIYIQLNLFIVPIKRSISLPSFFTLVINIWESLVKYQAVIMDVSSLRFYLCYTCTGLGAPCHPEDTMGQACGFHPPGLRSSPPPCLGLNQEKAALASLRPQQPLPVKFPEALAALPSGPGEHFPPNRHSSLHK